MHLNFLHVVFIVLAFCPHPSWTTNPPDVNTTDIMERLIKVETDLKNENDAKDRRIAALEAAMEEKNIQMEHLIEEKENLRQIVDQVRNQPFAIQCAWRNSWSYANSIITYERLYYDNTSGGPILNGTMYGGLDINTGAFTVAPGFSGVWTVTYTIVGNDNNCSPTNEAYLYINGQRMGESRYHSGGTGAWQDSTSSRTVYMTLKIGDTVTFRTASMCRNLVSISLCFELIQ